MEGDERRGVEGRRRRRAPTRPVNAEAQRRRDAEDGEGEAERPAGVMTLNEITGIVVDAAIEVHRVLGGPGLLERVYEEALICELQLRGLRLDRQTPIELTYKGYRLASDLRLDMLVEQDVIVECKASAAHHPVFEAQALTYLRLSGLKVALVINFGVPLVKDGIHRVVNNV